MVDARVVVFLLLITELGDGVEDVLVDVGVSHQGAQLVVVVVHYDRLYSDSARHRCLFA